MAHEITLVIRDHLSLGVDWWVEKFYSWVRENDLDADIIETEQEEV